MSELVFLDRLSNGDYSIREFTLRSHHIGSEIVRVPRAFNSDPYRRALAIAWRMTDGKKNTVYVNSSNKDAREAPDPYDAA